MILAQEMAVMWLPAVFPFDPLACRDDDFFQEALLLPKR
jgi:hypothetical protein